MDQRTIEAARNGDRDALASLLRGLQDAWYRFSLSLLGDAERARDATQETALRFLRMLPGFRGESQLHTWSLGIALNVAREFRRKNRAVPDEAREVLLRRESVDSPEASADLAERRAKLHAVLETLPQRQREAIVLRFFEELSVDQTAELMQCAEGTVKATVHQALRSLRTKLEDSVGNETGHAEVAKRH